MIIKKYILNNLLEFLLWLILIFIIKLKLIFWKINIKKIFKHYRIKIDFLKNEFTENI